VGFLVISVFTLALIVGTVVLFSRAKKASRAEAGEGVVTRADTQRYLAANWALVEASARESGMSDDEIARVRSKIVG
jgi:cbb3-type cytochrome oxidase subunit 3